jgi:glycosyltransferase involved in cell wall biosynthesis|tara:strand:+ start:2474 stop:3565 length:1092 start_codon:yes stop_codon:yes gene_type:complete
VKKVLYINDVIFASGSGEVTHTVGILNALERAGVSITYLTFQCNKEILLNYGLSSNIHVLYKRGSFGGRLGRIIYFLKLTFISTRNFDYIYVRDSVFTFLLLPFVLLRTNNKLVIEYNGVREFEIKSLFLKVSNYLFSKLSRVVANRAHKNVAVASGIEFYLSDHRRIKNTTTINNGSNLSQDCQFSTQEVSTLAKVIVFVGNVATWQNFDLLIKLATENSKFLMDHNVVFHIYGDGVDLVRLQQAVVDNKVEDIVVFKGKIANHKLPSILSSCNAGLLIDKRFLNGLPLFSPLKLFEYNMFDVPSIHISDSEVQALQESGYYIIGEDNFTEIINIFSRQHKLSAFSRRWDDVAQDFLNKVFC